VPLVLTDFFNFSRNDVTGRACKKKEKKETIRASPKSQLEVRKDFDHGIITLQSKMRKKRQKT